MNRRALGALGLVMCGAVFALIACGGGSGFPGELGAYDPANPNTANGEPAPNGTPGVVNGNPSTASTPGGGGCPPCNETVVCSNIEPGQSDKPTTITLISQNGQCVVAGDDDGITIVLTCSGTITGNGQTAGTWAATGNGGLNVTTTNTTTTSTGGDASTTTQTTVVSTCVPTTSGGSSGSSGTNTNDGGGGTETLEAGAQ